MPSRRSAATKVIVVQCPCGTWPTTPLAGVVAIAIAEAARLVIADTLLDLDDLFLDRRPLADEPA
jgi:hypothetical protein